MPPKRNLKKRLAEREPIEQGYEALSGEELYILMVNRLGVKPRGFPWISRTLPRDHRPDSLEQSGGSRSGRPRPPMPAVAPSAQREGC